MKTHPRLQPAQNAAPQTPSMPATALSFGERINCVLRAKRRSKTWLAEQLEISKQRVNYLLRYATKPKHVDRIAHYLHINPEWLLSGCGPMENTATSADSVANHHSIPVYDTQQCLRIGQGGWRDYKNLPEITVGINTPTKAFACMIDTAYMLHTNLPAGTLIIIDPERTPSAEDTILAYLPYRASLIMQPVTEPAEHTDIWINLQATRFSLLGVVLEARIPMVSTSKKTTPALHFLHASQEKSLTPCK